MKGIVRGGVIGTLIALVLNVIIYFVTSATNVPLSIVGNSNFDTVPLIAVILLTIVPSIGAALFLWALDKFTAKPVEIFLWIALILGLLSLLPTFFATETRGAFIGLGLMHVAAAMGIVWGLLYSLRGSDDSA